MLKKLPIGIQTFKKIRDCEQNYLYVDKTEIAYDLIEHGSYYFLSRPRRFGKSLFIDTLHNIFEGNRSLFEGLAIESRWDWDVRYPVIKISFGVELRSEQQLRESLLSSIQENQKRLGVVCQTDKNISICFKEFIALVSEKYNQKVVVLIDEYDKAILDNLDQTAVAVKNRDVLKGFYTVIKESDPYLKFVMLTGVSKFSKASIFSGLNMLQDISLDKRYGNICGYTQEDVETTFLPYLNGVDMEKLKVWYNGYNFLKDSVYNPFDILLFIDSDHLYKNYWFSTGTPMFLIKLIEENHYFLPNLSNLMVGEKLLDSFDIENLDLEVILYQTGYLTIEKVVEKRRGGIEYKLKLPNEEVKRSFSDVLIDFITHQTTQKLQHQDDIYDALLDTDLDSLEQTLKAMFASIPYNNYTNNTMQNYEGYYASVLYAYLQSLGLDIIGEDVTNRGRIDLTLKIADVIYIMEFKMGGEDALKQIKERGYVQKYSGEKRRIYLVGINFDQDARNISSFRYEKV